jgi:type IV pilus assembly protein PilE
MRTLPTGHARRSSGFTLTEIMMALMVMSILAALAYPAYQTQMLKSRRAEALAALLSLQQAQERWRGSHGRYATLAELGVGTATPNGLYLLDVQQNAATSYVLGARAIGSQTHDKACTFLKLTASGGNVVTTSGADGTTANADAANRRCWNT